MKGSEFIRFLQREAKLRGLELRVVKHRGKGSHVTVYLDSRFTIVKDRKKEIGTGLYRAMLRQLGLEDLE